jgi:hypothetical protein
VGLIGVVSVRGELCEVPPNSCASDKIQKALETKNGLKQFRAVTDCHGEPTLDMTTTET